MPSKTSLSYRPLYLLVLTSIVAAFSLVSSRTLAGPIGTHCATGIDYSGLMRGENVTIAGVPTYYTRPKKQTKDAKKVLLFLSDVYGPFYTNNYVQQDYFADQGYHVLGIDYFLGDPIGDRLYDPTFDLFGWIAKSRAQAREVLPRWVKAVKGEFGRNVRFTAAGYCFGSIYAMEYGATDDIVAAMIAHPADLTEAHFEQIKKPLYMAMAEFDVTFSTENRRRSEDILDQRNATFHSQLFSGTEHGFATRGDLSDPNARWSREQAARMVIDWFNRFSE